VGGAAVYGGGHTGVLRGTRSGYAGEDEFRENEETVAPSESSVMSEMIPREMTQ